jgi:hypothetical protein
MARKHKRNMFVCCIWRLQISVQFKIINMSILKKIVLSVIPITLISYVFLNFFFYWDISMQVYNTIWVIAAVLVLLYYFIMYRLIWSEDIPRSEKNTHLILVVFIAPYGLYYIWFVFNKKP